MVILDAVSSGTEVGTFCVLLAVCSIAPICLGGVWETISTVKVWRRGIACRYPSIQYSAPVRDSFYKKVGLGIGGTTLGASL